MQLLNSHLLRTYTCSKVKVASRLPSHLQAHHDTDDDIGGVTVPVVGVGTPNAAINSHPILNISEDLGESAHTV